MRMTSGLTARHRAMTSRCCWPPERDVAGASSRSETSSQSAALSRLRRTVSVILVELHPSRRGAKATLSLDRHREGARALKDHANLLAQQKQLAGGEDVVPVQDN